MNATNPHPEMPFTALARQRCAERWATKPTLTEQRAAVQSILQGQSIFITALAGAVEEHVVAVRTKAVRVLFAPGTAQIITCLPNTTPWNRVARLPPARLTAEELAALVEGHQPRVAAA